MHRLERLGFVPATMANECLTQNKTSKGLGFAQLQKDWFVEIRPPCHMHLNCCMSSCPIERPQQKSRVRCNVAVHRTRYPRKAKPELEYNPLISWRNPPSDPNESKGAIFIYGVSGSCQFPQEAVPLETLESWYMEWYTVYNSIYRSKDA